MFISRRPISILAGLVALSFSCSAFSGSAGAAKKSRGITTIGAWMVLDATTGKIMGSRNPNRPWYPASLTKLMTAYVTFQAIKAGRMTLQSRVMVSQNALAEPPSKMGFRTGTVMTVDNALKMVLVKSANDISVALGEAVAGKEEKFVTEMNHHARRLGMTHTRFVNPNGLPAPRQVTSARDMAILARALIRQFPQHRHYYRIPGIRHGRRVLRSYNLLLGRVAGVDGMKTGYICNSAYNLVASATRSGRILIAVVMGARSSLERAVVAKSLLEKGYAGRSMAGATTMANIAGMGKQGSLPPNRYCKKIRRPSGSELVAAYGRVGYQPTLAGVNLRYAEGDRGGNIVVRQRKKRRKGKRRKRRDLVGELIGRRRGTQRAVRVFLGLPSRPKMTRVVPKPLRKPDRDGRRLAALTLQPIDGVTVRGGSRPGHVPVPTPHPTR